jgi:hypothetical protein
VPVTKVDRLPLLTFPIDARRDFAYMSSLEQMSPQLASISPGVKTLAPAPVRPRKHRRTKPQLSLRNQLKRNRAIEFMDSLIAEIEKDLGGHDQLSAIERSLVEGYGSSALLLQNLTYRLARGEDISIAEHATTCSAMVRIASRLGLKRVAKDINATPDLQSYLAQEADAAEHSNGLNGGSAKDIEVGEDDDN